MAGDVEVRGFALMLAVRVAYLAFLLWLFTPEAYLQELGITYYPFKYWAVAGPAWLTLALVWGYWVYEGLNMTRVPPLSDSRNLADARCKSAEHVGLRGYTQPTTHAIPPLCHIPPDVPAVAMLDTWRRWRQQQQQQQQPGIRMKRAELSALLAEVDHDGSGKVEYPEFLEIMTVTLQRLSEEKGSEKNEGHAHPAPPHRRAAAATARAYRLALWGDACGGTGATAPDVAALLVVNIINAH
ncbi:hypothetical protein HXX76_014731 [Chlamydomonas incerta]|uniref:EF-hand domain-containing protein n=1 Tax=Chlamydomonas incerta TaxID=51695 RepID=A0A835VSH5_CHLIN|nr:hypothetical protein HXX76_014731 [Chlamydomonas incerta]|eukprot:KAG2424198.1 hypothetical protein HXX76_014731 [Chlamydomonas incerta]